MAYLQPTSAEAVTSGDYSPQQISRMDPAFLKSLGLTRFGTPIPASDSSYLSLKTAGQRIAAPDISKFQYSSNATNYPTYMRQLGEANAQQAFQNQARYGAQLGNSVQGYQKALTDRNTARLGYMNQAGQAQMGVEGAQNTAHNQYQDLLARLFEANIGQRGQELAYLKQGAGGGTTYGSVLGGSRGGSTGGGGGFIGIGQEPGGIYNQYGTGNSSLPQW